MSKNVFLTAACVLLMAASLSAQTTIPGGNVSGTWDLAGSPYLVEGEITVPSGQTFTVDAGVSVEFQGHYKLIVNGTLTAIGTEEDQITFTAANSTAGWHSIRFNLSPAGSELTWCILEYGRATGTTVFDKRGGAIYVDTSNPTISHCIFHYNSASWGAGIYSWMGSPLIENCNFYMNSAPDAAFTNVGGSPVIVNCILWNNGGVYEINGTPSVTYSDIEGGYAGAGNVNGDPLWVDPDNGDYNLQSGSPCVDAGDPSYPLDPDASYIDIGVYYLHHEPLAVPYNLDAALDSSNGLVTLTWQFDGGGGGGGDIDTLMYDNGVANQFWYYPSATMSCRMTPASMCDVLELMIYTSGTTDFNAEIYPWLGSQPGTTLLFQQNVTAVNNDFTVLDVSSAGLSFDDDFMVGFGHTNNNVALGTDSLVNFNRCWDFAGGSWSIWPEQYLIRAVVQYESGEIAILEPAPMDPETSAPVVAPAGKVSITPAFPIYVDGFDNTDDFIEFIVYRNSYEIGRTADTTFTNQLAGVSPFMYIYTVTALFDEGESFPSNPDTVIWDHIVGVKEVNVGALPTEYALHPAHPNPFNPVTTISYALPQADQVTLKVFDINGRAVATLVEGYRVAGNYDVTFDAQGLASGVYVYQINTSNFTSTGKMILMK
ncbi:T9SS type A sorting domain-containing protein [bacterium]|nr:T9SS type A sorting domain-containing protein [bacterium]